MGWGSHLNGSYSAAVTASYRAKLLAENLKSAVEAGNTAAADTDQAAEAALKAASGSAAPDLLAARKNAAEIRSLGASALQLASHIAELAGSAYDAVSSAEAEDKARIGSETAKQAEDVLTHTTRRDDAFKASVKTVAELADAVTQLQRLSEQAQKLDADTLALPAMGAKPNGAERPSDGAAPDKANADAGTAPSDLALNLAAHQAAIDKAAAFGEAMAGAAKTQAQALKSVQPFCIFKGATIRFEFDADSNWILFVEEGSRLEEGTLLGVDLSKLGLDLSRIGLDLGKDRVVSGTVVTVPKKNLNAYDIERLEGEGFGTFIVPFKVADTKKDTRVIPGGVVGAYYGLQLGRLVYFAGVGVTPISFNDPKNSIPQTRVGVSPVVGVMNLITLSLEWQIGFVVGWDYLGSHPPKEWNREGQPWASMIIGTTVLTQSHRVPLVNPE